MKFTIAIPAYKVSFLHDCIESVLSQSYRDFELIIVNDASPYDVESIVSGFDDKRIRYYKNKKNCGAVNLVDNWNICLSYAQGDYFICMGDDDKLLPDCLETYVDLINRYPGLDVYHGLSEIIDDDDLLLDVQELRPVYETVYSMMLRKWNGGSQFVGDFLYRTSALRDAGGFFFLPLAWGSDDITAYRAAYPKGIANTQTIVFQYRRNRQTLSNTGDVVVKIEAVLQEEKWTESFLDTLRPVNRLEEQLYFLLKRDKVGYIKRKILNLLIKDARLGSWNTIFHWLSNSSRIPLGKARLMYIYLAVWKNRIIEFFNGSH